MRRHADKGKAPEIPYDKTFGAAPDASHEQLARRTEQLEIQQSRVAALTSSHSAASITEVENETKIKLLEEEVKRLREEVRFQL